MNLDALFVTASSYAPEQIKCIFQRKWMFDQLENYLEILHESFDPATGASGIFGTINPEISVGMRILKNSNGRFFDIAASQMLDRLILQNLSIRVLIYASADTSAHINEVDVVFDDIEVEYETSNFGEEGEQLVLLVNGPVELTGTNPGVPDQTLIDTHFAGDAAKYQRFEDTVVFSGNMAEIAVAIVESIKSINLFSSLKKYKVAQPADIAVNNDGYIYGSGLVREDTQTVCNKTGGYTVIRHERKPAENNNYSGTLSSRYRLNEGSFAYQQPIINPLSVVYLPIEKTIQKSARRIIRNYHYNWSGRRSGFDINANAVAVPDDPNMPLSYEVGNGYVRFRDINFTISGKLRARKKIGCIYIHYRKDIEGHVRVRELDMRFAIVNDNGRYKLIVKPRVNIDTNANLTRGEGIVTWILQVLIWQKQWFLDNKIERQINDLEFTVLDLSELNYQPPNGWGFSTAFDQQNMAIGLVERNPEAEIRDID